jgi:hypothetical protein
MTNEKLFMNILLFDVFMKKYESLTSGDKKRTIKAGKGDELLNFQGLEF